MSAFDEHDDDTVRWCDEHAIARTECGCRPPGPAGLLTVIKSGSWLDEQVFPPLQYAVPNLIPEGYTVLVGPPKAGKSWLILDACLAVASGGKALGSIPVTAPGTVLYLALEDGDRRLQSRIRVLRPGDPIPERFHYGTSIERGKVITTIKAWLDAHPDTRMVVLDTLGKVLPPAARGETTYERDYKIGGALKAISDDRPGLAMVVVHHDRKAKTGDFVDSVSGTNGVAGAADAIVALSRERHADTGVVAVTGRDVRESDFAVTMLDGTTWRLMGDSLADAREAALAVRQEARAAAMGEPMREVLAVVAKSPDGVRAKDVAAAAGLTEKAAGVYLARAASAGLISKVSRGVYGPLSVVGSEKVLEVWEVETGSNTSNTSAMPHNNGGGESDPVGLAADLFDAVLVEEVAS